MFLNAMCLNGPDETRHFRFLSSFIFPKWVIHIVWVGGNSLENEFHMRLHNWICYICKNLEDFALIIVTFLPSYIQCFMKFPTSCKHLWPNGQK